MRIENQVRLDIVRLEASSGRRKPFATAFIRAWQIKLFKV